MMENQKQMVTMLKLKFNLGGGKNGKLQDDCKDFNVDKKFESAPSAIQFRIGFVEISKHSEKKNSQQS